MSSREPHAAPEHQCDGSLECPAKSHIHGCYADHGNCNMPEEHGYAAIARVYVDVGASGRCLVCGRVADAATEPQCPDCHVERADYEGPNDEWLPTCPNCGSQADPVLVEVASAAPLRDRLIASAWPRTIEQFGGPTDPPTLDRMLDRALGRLDTNGAKSGYAAPATELARYVYVLAHIVAGLEAEANG